MRSGKGSLGLESTLRNFLRGTKCCHRVLIGAHLELSRLPRVAPKSFSIVCKKYSLLEKPITKQPASSSSALIVSQLREHCTAAVPLLLYGLYVLPTIIMLRYERALYYCCTTTAVCIRTAVNVPHAQNSRCHVPRCFLELDMA